MTVFARLKDHLFSRRSEYAQRKPVVKPESDPEDEGDATLRAGIEHSRRTFQYFYHSQLHQFCSPADEPGTVNTIHGYLVWPVAIALWMTADCAKRTRSHLDKHQLELAYNAMERHWNPEENGYCAWIMFNGNRDIYYDDNAHCANALITAYEATEDKKYLRRAAGIATRLIPRGWHRDQDPGGVEWHVDQPNSRHACSTLSVAVMACRLALHGVEKNHCMELAKSCIDFSLEHLVDRNDGLVIDAIKRDVDHGESTWKPDVVKWTYNTGFAIEALLLWSQLSGSTAYLEIAKKMALAAINKNLALYDQNTPDYENRQWWDSTFFAQHLAEALVLLARALPSTELSHNITAEVGRFVTYCQTYLMDPQDRMFYRNLRMYVIDESRLATFNEVFNGSIKRLKPDAAERANGE
ncbi:hypothetical protein LTR04_001582, partial [Oleoguttula sp. CCFEE 6159]